MTEFVPATAVRALASLEAAGVPDARRLLTDYAAAGLVRSYALIIESADASGPKQPARGSAVAADLWKRMVREGATHDVWTGGSVRLAADDLIGGLPAISITGVGFHKGDLDWIVKHHGGDGSRAERRAAASQAPREMVADVADAQTHSPKGGRKSETPPIPPGAIFASVAQAGAVLNFKRTKINELMNDGRLAWRKIDGATKIEVASIMALAGGASRIRDDDQQF